MTSQAILAEVNTIFRDVLDLPELVLRPETTAKEVPEWDSLSHVQLVVAVEKHFKLKFTANEIRAFKNVGDLCAAVERKRQA
jgi:acyl carrier protein